MRTSYRVEANQYRAENQKLQIEVDRLRQMMQRIAEDVLPDPVRYADLTPEIVRDGFIKAWNEARAEVERLRGVELRECRRADDAERRAEQAEARLKAVVEVRDELAALSLKNTKETAARAAWHMAVRRIDAALKWSADWKKLSQFRGWPKTEHEKNRQGRVQAEAQLAKVVEALRAIADPKVPDNLGEPESRLYLAQQVARVALAAAQGVSTASVFGAAADKQDDDFAAEDPPSEKG